MQTKKPENDRNANVLGPLISITAAVIYGFMPLITKTAYAHGWNAFSAVAGRFLFAAIMMLIFQTLKPGASVRVTRAQFLSILRVACLFGVVPVSLYLSYNYISSGLATTLHFTYPIFVVIFERLFYRVAVTKRQILCLVLCMAGMILIYTPGGEVSLTGIALALTSGLLIGCYIVLYEHSAAREVPALTFAFWQMLIGAIEIIIIGSILGTMTVPRGAAAFASILSLAFFIGFLATVLFQIGVRLGGGIRASLLSTFEPLTSVIVGLLYFHEVLTLRSAAGMAAILLSTVLLVFVGNKR